MFLEPEVELPIATAALIGVVWLFVTKVLFGKGGKDDDI